MHAIYSALAPLFAPLLRLLHGLYGLGHNWALAFALLALLTKLVLLGLVWLWPGRLAQARLEGELNQLKKELPDPSAAEFRQRQLELLNKYRPAMRGGFVLRLTKLLHAALRMYVFVGLYFILTYGPELRGAPVCWVPDMTKPDPTYGLPLIILAVWFFLGIAMGGLDSKRSGLYLLTVFFWAGLHVFLPAGMAVYHLYSFFAHPVTLLYLLAPFGLLLRLFRGRLARPSSSR